MSGTTLRAIITFVLLFHGVAHLVGVIPAIGLVDAAKSSAPSWAKNWSSRSWLLTDRLGDGAARVIGIILLLASLVGFVGAGLGLADWLVPHDAWRTLAVVSAVISLVTISLYWDAFMNLFPQKVGCIGVNVATLVCLLIANWPSESDIGF
jgi:small-conductance mechanosensitive channel